MEPHVPVIQDRTPTDPNILADIRHKQWQCIVMLMHHIELATSLNRPNSPDDDPPPPDSDVPPQQLYTSLLQDSTFQSSSTSSHGNQELSTYLHMSPHSQHRYIRLDSENDSSNGSAAVATAASGDIELQSVLAGETGTRSVEYSRSEDSLSHDDYDDDDDGARLLVPRDESGVFVFHRSRRGGVDGGSGNREDLKNAIPTVYPQRWIQLGYLSTLALISDWVCFSTASIPDVFEAAYPGKTSEGLIDKFLFMNVMSCLCVTDAVARFGLQRCTKASSLLMTLGCWLRSGLGIVPVFFDLLGIREDYASFMDTQVFGMRLFGLPPYPVIVIGTLLVGMAQPVFQCTPPLLSAQWFASNERATSSAVALNFNQVGIAAAFVVGGTMADGYEGLNRYFALIAVLSTMASIGTFCQFQNLPPIPPSASELEKMQKCHREPPFYVSVRTFFSTPGFSRPLAAFICSIAITNVVGAFINEVMERGGVNNRRAIAWAGCGFEIAIVLGGILLGKYVDRTKEYKRVTLACIALSLVLVLPLGLTEHKLGKEPALLVVSLFLLGFFVGPVQPINAELAVDVTYPGDETAVESVQQFGGNLCSALLVPVAGRAAKLDYQILPNVPLLASDIRGDVIFMMAISIATYCFYRSFDAPLRRSMMDGD
mmetsp:Transcript_9796/g.20724  ORF Transcript_9796/g.20724 Transcript_9796/m.20724 type:complete len:655 (-) Transcript_9796:256-2220(-)